MRAIHVRDKMAARAIVIGRQRQNSHRGAKVRAANADIDHIGELRPAGAG